MQALARDGTRFSNMAVLYRSNAQSRVLEHALFNAAIPYRVYGGMRFFERAEVKHALAYLRLVAVADDDGAFLRVVNFPPRGIGARTLETLQDAARDSGTSLWQAACAGAGLVMLPHFMAGQTTLLTRVMTTDINFIRDWFLVVHQDLQSVPRIRAVIDFICTAMRRDHDVLMS